MVLLAVLPRTPTELLIVIPPRILLSIPLVIAPGNRSGIFAVIIIGNLLEILSEVSTVIPRGNPSGFCFLQVSFRKLFKGFLQDATIGLPPEILGGIPQAICSGS